MPRKGTTAPAILALFDEGLGGLAAPSSVIAEILRQRKVLVSKSNLLHTLDRLAKKGELSKIERPKGGAIYTRPRNLEKIPSYRERLERLPALNLRRKASTTEKRYNLRVKRVLKKIGDDEVRKEAHDHRPNHKCPVCGEVTPEIRLAE
jgi:hypothetical protein